MLDFWVQGCYSLYVVERVTKKGNEMTHFNGKELRITNTRGFWVARDGNQVWTRNNRNSLARFLEAKGYRVW